MALPYGSHHKRMMEQFIQAGYPPHVAAGFVGNAMMESTVNIDPTIVNSGEGAIGAFQHRLSRRKQLEALAAKHGKSVTDLDTQIAFALEELGGPYAKADARIRGAQTPEEAAALIDRHYEQSAQEHTPQRQEYARHVYNQYTGGSQPSPSPTQGASANASVGGPGAAMAGNSPVIQSILDQIAAENGGGDMMGMASQDVAPEGATDLMAAQPEEPGLSTTQRVGLGIGALGEALSAWSGKRPMDLDFIHEIPMAAQKRKQQVNEREAMIQLLNEEGFTDIAEAGVNGLSLDDMRTAYEARLAATKPTSHTKNIEQAAEYIRQGKPAMAESLLRSIGAVEQPLKLAQEIELMESLTPEQRQLALDHGLVSAPNLPDVLEISQRLADPTLSDEERQAIERQIDPATMALVERIGTDPEFAEWYETQQNLQGPGVSVETNIPAGEKQYQKFEAEQVHEQVKQLPTLRKNVTKYRQMRNLLDTGMETGRFQALVRPIKEYASDIFGIDFGDMTQQEVFHAMTVDLLPARMAELQGAHSDFEGRTYMETLPGLSRTELGNRALLFGMEKLDEREMEITRFTEKYFRSATEDKPAHSLAGLDEALEKHLVDKYGADETGQPILFRNFKSPEDISKANLELGEPFFVVRPDGTKELRFYGYDNLGNRVGG